LSHRQVDKSKTVRYFDQDIHRNRFFKDKPYRAVMHWLITNGNDSIPLGVINIDAEKASAFDDESEFSRRRTAYQLCAPFLRSIALLLSHQLVYANFRTD
jgi:hypothetical protein